MGSNHFNVIVGKITEPHFAEIVLPISFISIMLKSYSFNKSGHNATYIKHVNTSQLTFVKHTRTYTYNELLKCLLFISGISCIGLRWQCESTLSVTKQCSLPIERDRD